MKKRRIKLKPKHISHHMPPHLKTPYHAFVQIRRLRQKNNWRVKKGAGSGRGRRRKRKREREEEG
jgi:hypothetical protein